MSDTSDISSLYQRFGGDPYQYHEVGQTNQAQASRERWPLLSAIRPERAVLPPSVGERAESPNAGSPWPSSTAVVAAPDMPIPLAAAVRVEPWLTPPVKPELEPAGAVPVSVPAEAVAVAATVAPSADPAPSMAPAGAAFVPVAAPAVSAGPVAIPVVPAEVAATPRQPFTPVEPAAPAISQAPVQAPVVPAASAAPVAQRPAEPAPASARGSLKNVFARLASGSLSSSKQP